MAADTNYAHTTIHRFLVWKIVGIVIFLGIIVVGLTWYSARGTIRLFAEALIGEKLQLTTAELHGFFDPVEHHLIEVATWGREGLLTLDDPSRVEKLVIPILRQYPWVSSMTLADENGSEFTIIRDEERWRTRSMNPPLWGRGIAHWAEWTDDSPARIESEGKLEGYDPRTRPWFIDAIGKRRELEEPLDIVSRDGTPGQVYWTEPYKFFILKRPGVTVCVAYESPDGVEQIVAFDLLVYDIHDFTDSIGGEEDPTRAFVVTHEADPRVLGLPLTDELLDVEEVEGLLLQEADDVAAAVGEPLVADATSKLMQHIDENRPIRFLSQEEYWWGEAKAFTPSGSEDPVAMIVMVPEAELLGDIQRQLLLMVLGTLVASALVIAYTIRMGRAISRPFEQLADEGEQLSCGVIEARAPIESRLAEVNQLEDALDSMRDSLGTLFRVEHSLRRARTEGENVVSCIRDYDISVWSEADHDRQSEQLRQAVPHQTATICDHITVQDGASGLLLLADATGEGLESEFLAAQVRSMVRMAARLNPDVTATAVVINDHLYSDMSQGHFVSSWIGRIADHDGTLTHYAAGLQPLFHYEAARKTCNEINADTMPLGVFEDTARIKGVDLKMGHGDIFAVTSDRVFTFKDTEGRTLPPQRICEAIEKCSSGSAGEILGGIRTQIQTFLKDEPRAFECSIIVIKRV